MTARRLSETQLQTAVIATAKRLGWRVAHFGSTVKIVKRKGGYATIPDKGASGFPDLVLVRPPRIIFAELKGHTGQVSDAQQEWLSDLTKCAKGIREENLDWSGHPDPDPENDTKMEVYVWRPNDWESEVILRRLK